MIFFSVTVALFPILVSASDLYANFAQLVRNETPDKDFRIVVSDRNLPHTVFAIHGGKIENGTSELANAIAGNSMNRYLFEGLKITGNMRLHITSNHFDEPEALKLAKKSNDCLSVHGYKNDLVDNICIGGSNSQLARKLKTVLDRDGFPAEYPCSAFPGTAKTNIVNLCKNQGVQIEISSGLRKKYLADRKKLDRLAATIKSIF